MKCRPHPSAPALLALLFCAMLPGIADDTPVQKDKATPVPAVQQAAPDPRKSDDQHAAYTESEEERNARMKWWRDAKFGMFIHWGLYSGLAGDWKGKPMGSEWIQKNAELDTDTYAAEALPLFQPKENFAQEWAELAEAAGCRYAVMTTKHHDGFALFKSDVSDFDAFDHKSGRDLVKEYADAFRAKNIRIGLYHSVIDWHHPSYDYTICPDLCYPKQQAVMLESKQIPRDQEAYKKYLQAQVKELLSNYGKVDVIWWDYSQGDMQGKTGWNAPELIKMARKLQPGIIMNNRLYSFTGLGLTKLDGLDLRCGDFTTPEKSIPTEGYAGIDWEACMTIGDKWGYNRHDTNIKSKDELVLKLAECTVKGGNLLLNVNPQADGTIPMAISLAMKGVGSWLRIHGEAVYETRPVSIPGLPEGVAATTKGKNTYLFIMQPSSQERKEALVIPMPKGFSKAEFLDGSPAPDITPEGIILTPEALKGKTVPVLRLSK